MGWIVDDKKICPKCKKENAVISFWGDEANFLCCPDCGLCLMCEEKKWVISSSYIDEKIIGKNTDEIHPGEDIDENRNEDIIPKGTIL